MTNPFNVRDQRRRIEEHKSNVLANPWKQDVLNRITEEQCLTVWIEQMGDAELYELKFLELRDKRLNRDS